MQRSATMLWNGCDESKRPTIEVNADRGGNILLGVCLLRRMTVFYRLTADLVVIVHFAFVMFVVMGLLLTLLGGVRQWRWVRSIRFRVAHLVSIGIVVVESLCGITCPLTVWEQRLRELAGETSYRGDFIATWVHGLLFFDAEPSVFTLVYCSFGAAVVLSWILVPPKTQNGK
jgi:hypothetical protein